jgi:hemin uptake protein HemP
MIAEICVDDLQIITDTVSDDHTGTRTPGIPVNVKGLVMDDNKLVIDHNGQEVAGQGVIMFPPEVAITYESKIRILARAGIANDVATKEYIPKSICQFWTHKEVTI